MSVIDFTRPRVRRRVRVRRRRPPTAREMYLKGFIGTLVSQTAWMGVQIARGNLLLLAVLPFYPLIIHALRILLQRAREYERIGHPQPVQTEEWLCLGVLVFVQVALWMTVTL